jgi:anhydro-N-acetylmuramic acid kinase|tara:strand:+ start:6769 stop:7830 length:1062 start_codon:yes stop_codon:yes gene_type:complete
VGKKNYNVIGVMSGTSLDGIDVAFLHFEKKEQWTFSIQEATTYSYSENWKLILQNLHQASPATLAKKEILYTRLLGETILKFIDSNGIESIDLVSSHGHTVFHEPAVGKTYQIGNQEALSKQLGKTVVCDFRTQDVLLGGQGAPLVPMGDVLLFSDYDACLNLGGFANGSMYQNNEVYAYDLCAVNTVLNWLAEKKGMPFDSGGAIAKKGILIHALFNALEALDFYKTSPPKSLGIEWVNAIIFPLLAEFYDYKLEDIMHTYSKHISLEISRNFNKKQRVLVTGGGAKNTFLISALKNDCQATLIFPEDKLIDFKEALIFGFLGVLRVRNEVNCLASVTGASMNHSSGNVFYP